MASARSSSYLAFDSRVASPLLAPRHAALPRQALRHARALRGVARVGPPRRGVRVVGRRRPRLRRPRPGRLPPSRRAAVLQADQVPQLRESRVVVVGRVPAGRGAGVPPARARSPAHTRRRPPSRALSAPQTRQLNLWGFARLAGDVTDGDTWIWTHEHLERGNVERLSKIERCEIKNGDAAAKKKRGETRTKKRRIADAADAASTSKCLKPGDAAITVEETRRPSYSKEGDFAPIAIGVPSEARVPLLLPLSPEARAPRRVTLSPASSFLVLGAHDLHGKVASNPHTSEGNATTRGQHASPHILADVHVRPLVPNKDFSPPIRQEPSAPPRPTPQPAFAACSFPPIAQNGLELDRLTAPLPLPEAHAAAHGHPTWPSTTTTTDGARELDILDVLSAFFGGGADDEGGRAPDDGTAAAPPAVACSWEISEDFLRPLAL